MSTPISTHVSASQTIKALIDNITALGNSLNVAVTATDVRYRTRQDEVLRQTAAEATKTIQQAETVLQALQQLEDVTASAEDHIQGEDGTLEASGASSASQQANTSFQEPAETATSAGERVFERIPLATTEAATPTPAPFSTHATEEFFTTLSSANSTGSSGVVSAENPGDTTLSSAQPTTSQNGTSPAPETTTLSASSSSETSANKYVGYIDTNTSSNTVEHANYTPGVTMSKQNLQELSDLHNKVNYGPEIFDEIWFEDEDDGYYDEYDDYGDYYDDGYGYYGDAGFIDGYEGEPMVLVGNPTEQSMLDVSQVTFERPQDMTVSKEEFDAIFEEIMWRAAIDDPAAKDKWYQTLTLIAQNESNMNPAAANGWDSNAIGSTREDGYPAQSSRGMFQTIPGTFAANHMGGTSTSIYDPAASMGAAVNYLMSRYGCDRYGNGLDAFYSARVPVYHGY